MKCRISCLCSLHSGHEVVCMAAEVEHHLMKSCNDAAGIWAAAPLTNISLLCEVKDSRAHTHTHTTPTRRSAFWDIFVTAQVKQKGASPVMLLWRFIWNIMTSYWKRKIKADPSCACVYTYMYLSKHTSTREEWDVTAPNSRTQALGVAAVAVGVIVWPQADKALHRSKHAPIPTVEDAIFPQGLIPSAAGSPKSSRGQLWPHWIINLSQPPPPILQCVLPVAATLASLTGFSWLRCGIRSKMTNLISECYMFDSSSVIAHWHCLVCTQPPPLSTVLSHTEVLFLIIHMDKKVGQDWSAFEIQDKIRRGW